jgi:hypothetical protein
MIEILSPGQRARRNFLLRAEMPQNLLLNKKTQPNARSYVSRLGYNMACTSYTQGIEIGRLSGSSLNRLQQKKRKDELKKLLSQPSQITEKVGTTVYDYAEYKSEIDHLRTIIARPAGNKKRISKSLRQCGVHYLSKRSKGKIRDKCTAFYRACGKQRTFCTLTFINKVTDKKAIEVLNKFFTQLREDFHKKFKYIWVAERQTENKAHPDNIHFHCILNLRLPVRRYNALWVLQQYNSGIEFDGITKSQIMQRIESETVHEVLNPFDVKNIKSVYGLSYYLTKYITKNQSEGFKCAAWHCSRAVSRLFTKTVISRSCMSTVDSFVNSRLDKKTGELKKAKQVKGAFYQLFYIENRPYFLREMAEIEAVNMWILNGSPRDKLPEVPQIGDFEICKFYNN